MPNNCWKRAIPKSYSLDFILNDNLDIDDKSSDVKGNIIVLKEENNKKFNPKKINEFN